MRLKWDAGPAPAATAEQQEQPETVAIDVSAIDFDNSAHDVNRPFEEAVLVFERVSLELAALKEREKILKRVLTHAFDEREGEQARTFRADDKSVTVTIKRTEKVSWDQDVLDQLVAGQVIPDYITKKLGVDNKRYAALDQETKQKLEPARTVSLNSPTIKIETE